MKNLTVEESLLFLQMPYRLVYTVLHGFVLPGVEGLNTTHVRTLLTLKDHGPVAMHTLGDWTGIPKGSLTQVIDRLIQEDLVIRERNSADRRVVKVEVTEKGKTVTGRIDERFCEHLNNVMQVLGEGEREEILQALKIIRRTTQLFQERSHAAGQIRVSRQ